MKVEQRAWTEHNGWEPINVSLGQSADLVLVFGAAQILKKGHFMQDLQTAYPNAHICGCSTAGEIFDTHVLDDSLVCTAVAFTSTKLHAVQLSISSEEDNLITGQRLAQSFPQEGLVHIFVISNGLRVNGSKLIKGLSRHLPAKVTVTGGLAADGECFNETLVFLNGPAVSDTIVGLGFYGNNLKVGYGSEGGWNPFGPERLITRSDANVLYEMDGHSALELYKQYLGKHAEGLPSTALLFPLCVREKDGTEVVRTILSIDEAGQNMMFAGDIPEGSHALLMRAKSERLIDGASAAAKKSQQILGDKTPELAVLISCVGRRMILKQRIEEEIEIMRETLGPSPILAGFYSYGEICPPGPGCKARLQNQTMTVTTFAEE